MEKKTVLIIDDDAYIGDMLQELLTKNGYDVARAYSGTEALFVIKDKTPDLILLDLMLPGLSGEELLPKVKDIPVIIVSAKADVDNKVALLLSGAADYVTKPFDTKELLARISVNLRKSSHLSNMLTFDAIQMDTLNYNVCIDSIPVKLTRTEYAILHTLMQNPQRVFSKDSIMSHIETLTPDCEESSLRTHVGNLRNKLKEINGKDYIEAVWGIGYKMKS